MARVVWGEQRPRGVRCRVLTLLVRELVIWSILLPTIVWLWRQSQLTSTQQLSANKNLMNAGFTSTHLPRVRSFHALHAHALRPGSCVPLLGHPLAMGSERPYALAPGLVHSNGRPTHVGCIHACAHVSRERWRATGPWLVHELAVVRLVWCHLEGGAHLENKKKNGIFV